MPITPTGARITGIGRHRASVTVTNDEVFARTGLEPARIETGTGIRERAFAAEHETIVSMGVSASKAALADARLEAVEIGLVVSTASTHRLPMPPLAPQIAALLGCAAPGAFDLNAGCAGFAYGLACAASAVRDGQAEHVLVVAAERMSDWTSPQDPMIYALFADGAGAAVVSRSEQDAIGPAVWASDGDRSSLIEIQEADLRIHMVGPLVFKWAVGALPDVVRQACAAASVEVSDLSWLVLHQANVRIINAVAKALEFPDERVVRQVATAGNTSSASVPTALSELRESGRTRPGDLAALVGFGTGLTLCGQVIRLP